MNYIKNGVIFAAGVAVGVLISYKYTHDKYERLYNEEVESLRKDSDDDISDEESSVEWSGYENHEAIQSIAEDPSIQLVRDKSIYDGILKKKKYKNYSDVEWKEVSMSDITIIPPDEFGDEDDYEMIELTYYADGIVADDQGDEVDNYVDVIGPDALDSFGQHEEFAVFVRNDTLKGYYEIIKDNRTHEEMLEEMIWMR